MRVHIDKEMARVQNGELRVTLYGTNQVTDRIKLDTRGVRDFEPGSTYTFLVNLPEDVGDVLAAELTWEARTGIAGKIPIISKLVAKDPSKSLYINKLEINPLFLAKGKPVSRASNSVIKPQGKCFRSHDKAVRNNEFIVLREPCGNQS